jgi:hypothetical protein
VTIKSYRCAHCGRQFATQDEINAHQLNDCGQKQTPELKLYCWRAKTYTAEAFVMAKSYEAARQALIATRLPWPSEPRPDRDDATKYELWRRWLEVERQNNTVDELLSLKYHDLIVLESGQVAWAEVS